MIFSHSSGAASATLTTRTMPAALIQSCRGSGLCGGALGEREHGRPVGDVERDRRQARARLDRRDVGAEHGQTVSEEARAQRLTEVARGAGDHDRRHQPAASLAARSRRVLLISLPLGLRGRGPAQTVITSGTL